MLKRGWQTRVAETAAPERSRMSGIDTFVSKQLRDDMRLLGTCRAVNQLIGRVPWLWMQLFRSHSIVESVLASAKIDRTSVVATCKIMQDPDSPWRSPVRHLLFVDRGLYRLRTWVPPWSLFSDMQCSMLTTRDRRVGRVCANVSGDMHDAV
jgi:hypothetical protein